MYHQQLSYCVTQFVEKDAALATVVLKEILSCEGCPLTARAHAGDGRERNTGALGSGARGGGAGAAVKGAATGAAAAAQEAARAAERSESSKWLEDSATPQAEVQTEAPADAAHADAVKRLPRYADQSDDGTCCHSKNSAIDRHD